MGGSDARVVYEVVYGYLSSSGALGHENPTKSHPQRKDLALKSLIITISAIPPLSKNPDNNAQYPVDRLSRRKIDRYGKEQAVITRSVTAVTSRLLCTQRDSIKVRTKKQDRRY